MSTPVHDVSLAERVCQLIEQHLDEPLTLADLAQAVGASVSHLHRSFKRALGISPRQYQETRRLGHLKARLRQQACVTTALVEAGFGSTSRVYEKADQQQAVSIRYTIIASPLGPTPYDTISTIRSILISLPMQDSRYNPCGALQVKQE